jgi:hypothetical protein
LNDGHFLREMIACSEQTSGRPQLDGRPKRVLAHVMHRATSLGITEILGRYALPGNSD